MNHISARQVHLDFHTSPYIENIGSKFNKEDFQKAIKEGNLTSITVFAKCCNSMCYYPTKVGKMHPHLNFDLLGEEIKAAHEIGVKAPVYIAAGWSTLDAIEHKEWRAVRKDGSYSTTNYDLDAKDDDLKPEVSWIDMCLNDGSYCNHIYDITKEVCDRYENLDGLFYDIVFMPRVCYCDECKNGMKKMGLDINNEEDAKKYYTLKRQTFMTKCKSILNEKHPNATIFFNSGGADQYSPEFHDYSTHFEMEDLPTVWGGYDKLPVRAKYFSHTNKDYMGMTGKFHMAWGEFGGFKSKEALKYEICAMMTYGAKCSIGDHLHPDGSFDMETYRNIGYAYRYAEKLEPYCYDSKPVTKLGLYLSGNKSSDEGAAKMLLETQTNFDVVYKDNFNDFDVIILPDCVVFSDEALYKFKDYILKGGKALICGHSLIKGNEFQIDFGIKYLGESKFTNDFVTVKEKVDKNMIKTPMMFYTPTTLFEVKDAEILATATMPYFNRTYGKFCGNKDTPYDKSNANYPAMIKNDNIVYIGHDICKMYYQNGSFFHRNYFINALNLIYNNKPLNIDLMSAGRAELILQENNNRYCLNVLYASPIQRGKVSVIEDIPTLYNIAVSIDVPKEIKRVYMPLIDKELEFVKEDNKIKTTIPFLNCHALVVFEY